jgi:hypothetical protein
MGTFMKNVRLVHVPGPPPAPEEAARAIRKVVEAFVDAWYWGDGLAMEAALHPDYVNRLVTLGAGHRPLGVQGGLGVHTPPDLRTLEVRILEARGGSASAVADVAGWVIHLHLAKASGQWRIVNVMWESR